MTEISKMKKHEEIGSAGVTAGLDFACRQILRILPDFTEILDSYDLPVKLEKGLPDGIDPIFKRDYLYVYDPMFPEPEEGTSPFD